MTCSVCKKERNEITPKKSTLVSNIQLYLCNDCLENRREPRWVIIMAGRAGNYTTIRPFLKNHRYVGEAITAGELHV